MTAVTDTNPPTAVPRAPATKARGRPKVVVRRPYEIHVRITPLMNETIEQMTGPNSHKCQADIVCDALNFYFMQISPTYRQEIAGKPNA
jgi:hypothetical protein